MNEKIAKYCLRAMLCEVPCEECEIYGQCGTDHCEHDAIRYVLNELEELIRYRDNGWIPCSSGEMPKAHNEVWITYKWNDGSLHVGRDRVIHGEWHCTKREAIIAWKYMKEPAPYKPKGENNNDNN